MKRNKHCWLLILEIILLLCVTVADADKDDKLRIHLLRKVTIQSDIVKLGEVTIVRADEPLASHVSEIPLGKISVPGQEVVLDRPMILSRLASNGIRSLDVTLTGAEEVVVTKKDIVITGKEIAESARQLLGRLTPARAVCEYNIMRVPRDMVLAPVEEVKLVPQLIDEINGSMARVRVIAVAGDEILAQREVRFQLKYKSRRMVTLMDIPANSVLYPGNAKVETFISSYPEPSNWEPMYGMVTKRKIPAFTVIKTTMVSSPEQQITIKRNSNVVIQIKTGLMTITASGRAVEQGKTGDIIKVKNVDSQRIVLTRVKEDGTVEPVY